MKTYDILGIGIGPFNLGLAALAADIPQLDCLFIERNESFNWHAGLLLPGARMQVPYYADLVTLADPTSRFTYLNYLKHVKRLFAFGIHDHTFPLRIEFNAYCQWVAGQLESLRFSCECVDITYNDSVQVYAATCWDNRSHQQQVFHAKHVVVGVGTVPFLPANYVEHPLVFHASEYLNKKSDLFQQKRITVIGSGQSAAEIFYDLLCNSHYFGELHWYTRSRRFYPMDYSKLALELSTPDYIEYFYGLSDEKKQEALQEQQYLYKGINAELVDQIYDELYVQRLQNTPCQVIMQTNCKLKQIVREGEALSLQLRQTEAEFDFNMNSDAVILAIGYTHQVPSFLKKIRDKICWNNVGMYAVNDDYSIDEAHSIFVQNADLHTHGFNSADLGLGPYRNAVILNTILKKEVYEVETHVTFQRFR
jgi:lysine N6-hydroxylase